LADGELNAREAEHVVWDVIVVGTGLSGSSLAASLGEMVVCPLMSRSFLLVSFRRDFQRVYRSS